MAHPVEPVNDLASIVPVMKLSLLDWLALIVIIIGGLNWGLIGIMNLDMAAAIFGAGTAGARTVYLIIGIAALYSILFAWRLAGPRR